MPVGNDVVDLRDPDNQPSAIHPRFDERVFRDRELRRLDELDAPAAHRLRWTMWAAKESAYKYIAQRKPGTPFRPGQMTVHPAAAPPGRRAARVEWAGGEVEVRIDSRPDRVHAATVADDGSAPICALRRIAGATSPEADAPFPEADPHALSAATRVLAARTVARLLGLRAPEIRIAAPPAGARPVAPRALRAGETLPVELSLSHDGAWIACAVVSLGRAPAGDR
ncbi:MAG: 4'-phosphopantetheinyl transferase superfamily protein [Gemmatimonadota bacterium]